MRIWVLAALLFVLTAAYGQDDVQRFAFSYPKMGTTFRIVLFAPDSSQAQTVVQECFRKLDELNTIFSDYEAQSELSRLSATAGTNQKVRVSRELWQILRLSKKFWRKSDGAFDVTIGPLSKLWRSMFRKSEIFDGVKIDKEKVKIGSQFLRFYPFSRRVRLQRSGMRLDLGGIAKGYSVDALAEIVEEAGFRQYLVDGGGDLRLGAAPPGQKGWRVVLLEKAPQGMLLERTAYLSSISVASSGDTYRYLEHNGVRYSHIIDPRTGYGVRNRNIVNVLAPDCTTADAVASALSVLDRNDWAAFIKKVPELRVF